MVNSWRVQQAAQAVRAGAVIAYPTEAVWGLGCDPWDQQAVQRLLMIKGRSMEKGLILVADNIRQFDFLFEDFVDGNGNIGSKWIRLFEAVAAVKEDRILFERLDIRAEEGNGYHVRSILD